MCKLNRNARALFVACAFLYPLQAAADSASASYRNTRSSVDSSGRRKTSASYRADGAAGQISAPAGASASYTKRDGFMGIEFQPGRVTDLWGSTGAAPGTVYLQWTAPGDDGYEGSTAGSFIVRYSSIAAKSPALSDAMFAAAPNVTPAPPAPSVAGTRMTMTATGLAQGVTYYFAIKTAERDGLRSVLSAGATVQTTGFAGCVVTKNVGSGQTFGTIQAAVDDLKANNNPLAAGESCVVIRDAATYPEQVTVQGFTSAAAGSSITIRADLGVRPVVAPNNVVSTAAFQIMNSSVNIFGIDVVASQNMPYGVWASSGYVQISSVNVSTSGNLGIYTAGIKISSWSAVSCSSVTVWNAHGLWLDSTANNNAVSYSTFQTANAASYALYVNGASSNTFTGILASNTTGYALYLTGASSNTITGSYMSDPGGVGASLNGVSNYNTISWSTMTSNDATPYRSFGLVLNGASSNTITHSYMSALAGIGAELEAGSNYNTISWSTVTAGGYALRLSGASYNTITQSFILKGPRGVVLAANANYNTISWSTITLSGATAIMLSIVSSNTIVNSYIQGSTAVYISGSTGTVIGGSVLVASSMAGSALQMGAGSQNLTLSSSSLSAPSAGVGLYLDAGNSGALVFATNTITGAQYGMFIATQAAGAFSLSVTSMTFANLTAGATAVNFTGGTIVSTFTTASFDASVAVNVNGAPLDPASRVTMRGSSGPRQGPDYENDPHSLVDWPDLVPPTAPALWFVGLSSIGVQYGMVGADGYVVTASTMANFSGVPVSSTVYAPQTTLAPFGLSPNTTYYLKTGSLWGQTTIYAQTVLSTATLSKLVAGTTVYQINVTSMVVNWLSLPLAPPEASSNSASGYILEVSTRSDFLPLWTSSATPNVALSTLTASGLLGDVTYYFRVGSLNWNSVPNYAAAVSTFMSIQLGVEMTTHTLSLPGLTGMNTTLVISTSIIVTNTGNVLETYRIKAATVTAGSPWMIAAAPAADRFALWTVVNSTQAGAIDFLPADKLSDTESACAAAVFTMGNQNCVQVPVGQTRTLWFQIATPLVTSTIAPQDIKITARAVKDP